MSYPSYHDSMRTRKERMTVTIDPSLLRAASEAVAEGRAESLSAWVNAALVERAAKERRLRALGAAIATYESEFGVITAEELLAQERADRQSARVVRGSTSTQSRTRRGRRRHRAA